MFDFDPLLEVIVVRRAIDGDRSRRLGSSHHLGQTGSREKKLEVRLRL